MPAMTDGDEPVKNHTVCPETNPPTEHRDGALSPHDDESGQRIAASWYYPNNPGLPALATVGYPQVSVPLLCRPRRS